MKPKTLVLMVVAVGFGLVAAYLTSRLGAVSQPEMVEVLVAAKRIERSTVLREAQFEDLFKKKKFVKGEEPKDAINKPEELKDKILGFTVQQDQHITAAMLTTETGPRLERGQRAYALRVDAEKVAGGFVVPNRRVDILLTERIGGEPKAKIILINMLVLAVDQDTQLPDNKGSKVPATVTLAVNESQARKLAEAKEKGVISFALRPPDDNTGTAAADDPDPKADTIDVWVAKEDIAAGTELDEQHLQKKAYPKGTEPKHALKELEYLRGKTVNRQIYQDQFITEADLKVAAKPTKVMTRKWYPRKVTIYNKNEPTYMFFAMGPDNQPLKRKNGEPYEGKPTLAELRQYLSDDVGEDDGSEGK